MFSIGPFHRATGQPAGFYDSLLPLAPEPLDDASVRTTEAAPAPAEPSMTRHALSMLVLLCLTLAVHSAVGWWTLPGRAPTLAPSAQTAPTVHVSSVRAPS